MADPNKIKLKIQIPEFIRLIRSYHPSQIDNGHAFVRLSQRQREIFTVDEIRKLLLKDSPFLVGIQNNGNHAVFYHHLGKNLRLIVKITPQKVKIVTFYYILSWQIPKI